MTCRNVIGAALAATLGLVAAARAQQGRMQGMGMDSHGSSSQGTTGMSNMQSMMGHCADMRRQMTQDKMSSGPDMRDMKAQCDRTDRQKGAGSQAPAGTRSR